MSIYIRKLCKCGHTALWHHQRLGACEFHTGCACTRFQAEERTTARPVNEKTLGADYEADPNGRLL